MSAGQVAANMAVFARFDEAVNSGDAGAIAQMIDEVISPDVLFHAPVPTGATGPEAMKQIWAALLRAFPDIHVAVEDVIANGDKIVSRQTVTGTNLGEYMGRPPTGKSVSYNEIFILRFAAGRIAEIWGVVDVLAQMRQLGLIRGRIGLQV
jgi:predicted ester cyclase